MTIAERALELIPNDSVVGLGTGRAASAFIRALGARVQQGLQIRGVPTSQASADLADQVGIPRTSLDEVEVIDVNVDGADEVDANLDLIKGYGGALVREKIVAAAAKVVVILVGAEKLTPVVGTRGMLPVEVVPFALAPCRRRLEKLGFPATPRTNGGRLFVSDNGNHILDCRVGALTDPRGCEQAICAIPGVVDTGLFLGMADIVLIQNGEAIETRKK